LGIFQTLKESHQTVGELLFGLHYLKNLPSIPHLPTTSAGLLLEEKVEKNLQKLGQMLNLKAKTFRKTIEFHIQNVTKEREGASGEIFLVIEHTSRCIFNNHNYNNNQLPCQATSKLTRRRRKHQTNF